MELCSIAKFVLIFSIGVVLSDIYLFGFEFFSILVDILFSVFFVWLANWACFSEGYNWIAWVVVIINFFSFVTLLYIIKYKNTEDIKRLIEEEKANRK